MLLCFRKIILLTIILTVAGSLYAWWQRHELLGWYYFQQLSQAEGAKRADWVNRLVDVDVAVLPRALERLRHPGEQPCADSAEVLIGLARNWKDARLANILKELLAQWGYFSEPGKKTALIVARAILEESGNNCPMAFLCSMARDLLQCAAAEGRGGEGEKGRRGEKEKGRKGEGENQTTRVSLSPPLPLSPSTVLPLPVLDRAALNLAVVLVRLEPKEMPRALLAVLTENGLSSPDYEVRALALRLFLLPPLDKDAEMLARVVPFLQDTAGEVRHLAVLAVGSNQDLVSDDDLLPLLHDADVEVSRDCELALRSRGLQDRHIVLARLIGDDNPSARLEVLQHLDQARDLDPGVWLRRLSQDPAAAVRAAAVRAAASQHVADLRDRLRDMAENDVSPTVRHLAGHYLRRSAIRQVRYSEW